jgi:hypothetical protein
VAKLAKSIFVFEKKKSRIGQLDWLKGDNTLGLVEADARRWGVWTLPIAHASWS